MRYVDYSGDTVFAIGGHDYSSSLLFYAQNDNGNHSYVPIDSNGGRVEGCVWGSTGALDGILFGFLEQHTF